MKNPLGTSIPRCCRALRSSCFSVGVLLAGGAAAVRGQSALDGFDPNANGAVRVVVVQPDGKILIGGDFTTLSPNGGAAVTRNRIARLNPDGTLDTAFNPNANDTVYSIAVQADGKILVGGDFTTASADRRATTSPGSMPRPAWLIRSTRTRTVLSIQSRCRRTARFWRAAISRRNSIGGQTRNRIARLDPTTGLADSFNPNANDCCPFNRGAGGRQDSGGRQFQHSIGGQTRNRIARLDPTTGLADSFNPNANSRCLFNRGAGGRQDFSGRRFHDSIGGQTRNHIARLDATTGLADSFNPNANGAVCFNRGAGGRQDFSGRLFHDEQHRRTDAQPHRPARCHDRLG